MIDVPDQDEYDDLKKMAEEARKRREQAAREKAAAEAQRRNALNYTAQELLLQNFKNVVAITSPISIQSTQTVWSQGASRTQNDYGLERNKYVLPTHGVPPEYLLNEILNPVDMRPFLQATPAQLASLQPTLRFFIVSESDQVTDTGVKKLVEEEIYFSDQTNEKRIRALANARANKGKPAKLANTKGSEAGIKSFTWNYHNKHEGDKIINAKLELYFGTLSELVNEDYMKFLFTNGRYSAAAPKPHVPSHKLGDRLKELQSRIDELKKCLKPGTKPSTPDIDKEKSNFRQLKVLVGWAVPKGNAADLQRIYGPTPNDVAAFKAAVRATQRVILLNLVDYDVGFSQEGPTTLTLDYVGSTDNFISSPAADILGGNNFSTGNLNDQQVMVPADGIDVNALDKDGYLYAQMTAGGSKPFVEGTNLVPITLKRIRREHEYLDLKRQHIKLKYGGAEYSSQTKKNLEKLDGQLNLLETTYKKGKKALRVKRYASLINNLMGGTGYKSKVYEAYATLTEDNLVKVDFKPQRSTKLGSTEYEKRLRKLANLSKEERESFAKNTQLTLENTFKRGIEDKSDTKNEGKIIPYVFLGDVILAGMQNAEMREDVKIITGTFCPKKLGIPGFENDPANYPLYDIPIALDYLTQFIYDNIISKDLDEFPFRSFLDSLISAVARLLSQVSDYKFRINFDYTLYMTPYEIMPRGYRELLLGQAAIVSPSSLLLTKTELDTLKPNLKNQAIGNMNPMFGYYILFARQANQTYRGNRSEDEKRGVYHYVLGADRGIAKSFNFTKQTVPQFKAMNIEAMYNGPNAGNFAQALVLPQNINIDMFGNAIHKNGDLIYVDSRALLGEYANEILTLGGYYRVVKSENSVRSSGFSTNVSAVFHHRTYQDG